MTDWYARARELAPQYGIDPDLAARVMRQESGGNPGARSHAGALGLMQLMPGTAAALGVDPNDPEQNLRGGLTYLKQQLDAFGTVPLALAAYNAGPGAVKKHGGVPPYNETQKYVASITGGKFPPVSSAQAPPSSQEAQMPQGTLPPVMAQFEPPAPTMLSNMAQNPWLQMGLGILSTGNIGEGLQQGLLTATQAEQKREHNRIWQQQVNQAQAGQMGMRRAGEAERMRNQVATEANRLREMELMQQQASGGKSSLPPKAQMIEYLVGQGVPRDEATSQVLPGRTAGRKQEKQAEDAKTVVGRIRDLRGKIESDPSLAGPAAKLKLWLGKAAGGIADETGSEYAKAISRELGTEALAEVRFGLAAAAAETARWVVNKGDTRMSNADMDRANEILDQQGWMTDSATTLQGLLELEKLITPYMTEEDRKTLPPETMETPPNRGGGGRTLEDVQRERQEVERQLEALGGP